MHAPKTRPSSKPLQHQVTKIESKIAALQRRLGNPIKVPTLLPALAAHPKKKHRISAAGRAKIVEAQRKRWAAAKKAAR